MGVGRFSHKLANNGLRIKFSRSFPKVRAVLLILATATFAYYMVDWVNATNDRTYAVALENYRAVTKSLTSSCSKLEITVGESYSLIQEAKTEGLLMPELLDELGVQSQTAHAIDCSVPKEAARIKEVEDQTTQLSERSDDIANKNKDLKTAYQLVMNDAVNKAKINLADVIDVAQKSIDDSDGIADNQLRVALIDIVNSTRNSLDQLKTLDNVSTKISQINNAKQAVDDNRQKVLEKRRRAEESRQRAAAAAAAERARAAEWQKVSAGQHIADTARSFLTDKYNAYLYSETWGYRGSPNANYLKAFRKLEKGQPDDCGNFVSTTILSSGVDSNFTKGWTLKIKEYLERSQKWDEVTNNGNSADLQPGDVFIVHNNGDGHTFIYLGNGQAAQARLGWSIGYAFDINKLRSDPEGFPWSGISMEKVMEVDGQFKDGIWQAYDTPYKIFRAHY